MLGLFPRGRYLIRSYSQHGRVRKSLLQRRRRVGQSDPVSALGGQYKALAQPSTLAGLMVFGVTSIVCSTAESLVMVVSPFTYDNLLGNDVSGSAEKPREILLIRFRPDYPRTQFREHRSTSLLQRRATPSVWRLPDEAILLELSVQRRRADSKLFGGARLVTGV